MNSMLPELDYKVESHFNDYEAFRAADIEVNDENNTLHTSTNIDDYEIVETITSFKKDVSSSFDDPLSTCAQPSKKRKNIEKDLSNEDMSSHKRTKLPKALYKFVSFEHDPIGQSQHFGKHFEFALNQGTYPTDDIRYSLPASRFNDISFLPSFSDDDISKLPSILIPNIDFYISLGNENESRVSKSKLRKGGPLLWFISMSGLRCMDIYRALRKTPQLVCGKFFAKHLKLQDQISFLQSTPIHIAVGTPGRFLQLFPHFATDNLHSVVLDVSYLDRTQRSLLTASDSREAFFQLYFKHLHGLCRGKEIPSDLDLESLPSDLSKKEKKRRLKKVEKEKMKILAKADTRLCLF